MACDEEISKLKEQITCALCGQLFKDPVTMGCGHTSCKDCLAKLVISKDGKVTCPTCSTECSPVDIVDNELAAKLVETLKKILELKPDEGDECQKHNLPYTVFCLDDMKLMCDKMAKEHPDCRTVPIKEAADRFKNQGDKVRDKIENAFEALKKYLDREESAIIQQVEAQEEIFLQQLEDGSSETGGNPVTIEHLIADIKNTLSKDDIPLLKVRASAALFPIITLLNIKNLSV
ncbi:hypothetical protein scyTo_0018028 [Scyliorhinus torazame]|uniref:RING-type domain-containing protein n=1 Tax=Scyliorhinus torazame TaxID=75743 RepID=A0A401Q479_SCYTO|nr:hypothetical protein [Scyliorhinus torazame]